MYTDASNTSRNKHQTCQAVRRRVSFDEMKAERELPLATDRRFVQKKITKPFRSLPPWKMAKGICQGCKPCSRGTSRPSPSIAPNADTRSHADLEAARRYLRIYSAGRALQIHGPAYLGPISSYLPLSLSIVYTSLALSRSLSLSLSFFCHMHM